MGLLRESYRQFDVNGSYKVIQEKKNYIYAKWQVP